MDWLLWGVVLCAALSIWGFIQIGKDSAQKMSVLDKAKAQLSNNAPILVKKSSIGQLRGLGISEDCILLIDGENLYPLTPQLLISAEVITDGTTTNKVSRQSQVVGGLVGAAIAGPVGAIIGGLGASSRTTITPPNSVKLRLIIADTVYPKFDIDFIEMTATGNTHGAIALDEAETWFARLQGVIHSLR
jgi:hypothetical protein